MQMQSPAPRLDVDVTREDIPCNLCGSWDHAPFCPENGRGLVQCRGCGLVYLSPRPPDAELYALYGETYFKSGDSRTVGYTDYARDEPNIRKTAQRRLKHLERYVKPGRMLDVGCSMGFFMAEAAARGWQVQGLDVSAFAVERTRARFGFDARHGSFLELDYPAGAYDLVTIWDVIEHVPDPAAHVQKAAELLRAGGVLVLATPNVDSLPARFTGKNWVGYKLSEEHVYYFSRRTLARMLEKAGFEMLNSRHVGKYVTLDLFFDRFGIYAPVLGKVGQFLGQTLGFGKLSLYINPFDIVCVTARKV
ncbi:MAG: class I SAM-dependent methyltransferase [Anaerolineae bacterium]|nr:class I SAM-dependent methyltransferase [Anaerolineae bacterium]